ncbi:MAG: hypothetical protein K9I74_01285 [Bacteroidales bacterium]|nr:hypothetical protein [Bacteroidales bacterium]
MKITEDSLKQFKTELNKFLSDLSKFEKLSDIQIYLNYFNLYLYSIELLSQGKTTDAIKKLWENIVNKPNGKESELYIKSFGEKSYKLELEKSILHDIYWNKFKNKSVYKYNYTLITMVSLVIFLNKKGLLPEMSHNPASYIKSLLSDILPHIIFEDPQNLGINTLLSNKLNSIDKDVWDKILRRPQTEITFYYWPNIDHNFYATDSNIYSIRSFIKYKNSNINLKDTYIIDASNDNILSYDQYNFRFDQVLRNRYDKPDLFLIDSVNLPEYLEKGILTGTNTFFTTSIESTLDKLSKQDQELAKTINGTREAIPLTRNFNIVGFSKNLKNRDDFDDALDKGIHDMLNNDDMTFKIDKCLSHLKIKNFMSLFKGQQYKLKEGCFSTYDIGSNNLVIPMQLAKGAHTAYTFFAYFANTYKEEDRNQYESFIHIEKHSDDEEEEEIEKKYCYLPNKNTSVEAFIDFFKLLFNYVPIISLFMDQKYSAMYRTKRELKWFDPCLPIEAIKFQKDKIINIKRSKSAENKLEPATSLNQYDKKMSCLGGYVISLSKESKEPFQAVDFSIELAQEYLKKVKDNAKIENIKDTDVVTKINYNVLNETEKKELYEDNKYFNTPENIAKRPSVSQWKEIESKISDLIRPYSFAVFLLRIYTSLIQSVDYQNQSLDTQSIVNEIEDNFDSILAVIEQNINTFFKRDISDDEEINLKEWIKDNLNDIKANKLFILSLIRMLTDEKLPKENYDKKIDKVIEQFAENITDSLYQRIASICFKSDWNREFEI